MQIKRRGLKTRDICSFFFLFLFNNLLLNYLFNNLLFYVYTYKMHIIFSKREEEILNDDSNIIFLLTFCQLQF